MFHVKQQVFYNKSQLNKSKSNVAIYKKMQQAT